MPTVIVGSALDVVERCGVPRYLHSDFPLGNPCGKPWDRAMQRAIAAQALELLAAAAGPNTTWRTPHDWGGDGGWRDSYARVDEGNREELARRGAERRARQRADRAAGGTRAPMIAEV